MQSTYGSFIRARLLLLLSPLGPILKPLTAAGTLQVVSARYDLDDGVVEILP